MRVALDDVDEDLKKKKAVAARKKKEDQMKNSPALALGISFADYYKATMAHEYAEDIETMRAEARKNDAGKMTEAELIERERGDVAMLTRALLAGADLIPDVQQELALQFATIEELKMLKLVGGSDDEKEEEEDSAEDSAEDDDVDADAKADSSGKKGKKGNEK